MELTCLTPKTVYLDGKRLDIKQSLEYWKHSPTGFMWGYGGSGPAQLALAVMMKMTGKMPNEFLRHYQEFKKEIIARLPQKAVALEMDFFTWYNGSKNYRFEVREIGDIAMDADEEDLGKCSFPDKCQKATWRNCDCACNGCNHGTQARMFD